MDYTFLTPVSAEIITYVDYLTPQQLGTTMVLHTSYDFPDLDQVKVALIGVNETRGSRQLASYDLDEIRKAIYGLFSGNWNLTIADLGDIKSGETIEDTYFALQQMAKSLLKNNCIPIIIGGTQDLTYPLYRAYDGLEQMVNLVTIDDKKSDCEIILIVKSIETRARYDLIINLASL